MVLNHNLLSHVKIISVYTIHEMRIIHLNLYNNNIINVIQIKESLPNFSERNSKESTKDLDIGFHVSGEINQVYSEHILSHLCN